MGISATVNWSQVGVFIAVVAVGGGFFGWLGKKLIGDRFTSQDDRMTKHEEKLEKIETAGVTTALTVARIEGYMAASNGGGNHLPNTPTSDALAEELLPESTPATP